jgi:hypothetical protein
MPRVIEHPRYSTHEVVENDSNYVANAHSANVAERIVWLVAAIILTLLSLRFIFAMFGANPTNGFVNFIYSASRPFVAPFFNIFNYNYVDNGVGRVEVFTLVAILVYGLIAAIIARLVSINRP